MEEDYYDLVRKCATIISKKQNQIEMLDSTSFETLKATIDEALSANVNDQVTYVQTDDGIKVLEVRKR
ncbi:hypothetical protein KY332_00405 [Candidatus Woesearchaeota archaeon]|nr:hypothetical protein [Candidatus Woesearchaeota archaeon]